MIAIGRGNGLYESIKHLHQKGHKFDLIITDTAYEEYSIKEEHFNDLASTIGAKFFCGSKFNLDDLKFCKPDFIISANWKYKIKSEIIESFPFGIINCHMGKLPDYKGNATPNWLIIQGETEMFVDIHKMEDELDTGDIISRKIIPITEETYVSDLWDAYNNCMPELFDIAINRLLQNKNYSLVKNDLKGMRCYPRNYSDHRIDWNMDAKQISRLIRASSRPLKGAFCDYDGKQIIVWKATETTLPFRYLAKPGQVLKIDKQNNSVIIACGTGALRIEDTMVDGEIITPSTLVNSIKKRFL